ncbi:MAG: SIMPL domain-containing protein, partial [Blastocatellia bacterium]|nr:SIMPL domain-containing protein [Blastocatellia bacterium]
MSYMATLVLILFVCITNIYGQVSGNISYQNSNATSKVDQIELANGRLYLDDRSFLIEANILLNAKADEYLATFSLNEEGKTIEEANQKIDKKLANFITGLHSLGINRDNFYVDFVTQNKIYSYENEHGIFKENLIGFEVKKNVLIRYKNEDLLDKLTVVASKADIYDLVKVDHVLNDVAAVRDMLFDEAVKVINKKEENYISKLGLKVSSLKQVYTIKYDNLAPSESYLSYQAAETNQFYSSQSYTVQTARKNRTFFYKPLDSNRFDKVINPS